MPGSSVVSAGKKNPSLKERYNDLSAKFQKQTKRDQFMILLAALVVVIMPAYMYGVEPAQKNAAKARSAYSETQSQIAEAEQMRGEWLLRLQQDPNEAMRREIAQLEEKLKNLDASMAETTVDLIPAFDISAVLQEVLSATGALKLISMKSLEPFVIMEGEGGASLYRHGARLVLEGGYLDAMKYLQALENLSRRFMWGGFSYEVKEYPKGTVTIEVYTLSNSKDFISG